MSLAKNAQLNLDGENVPAYDLEDLMAVDDDVQMLSSLDDDEDLVELDAPTTIVVEHLSPELDFTLPLVPGGDDQDEIEEPAEIEIEEPEEEIVVETDSKKWTVPNFMVWLHHKMHNFPPHSGRDTVGLERTISYAEFLDREISKAVRMDIDGVLDVTALEKARDELRSWNRRAQERLDKIHASKYPSKKKKKADGEPEGLIKEAGTAVFTIAVPVFISHIARVCINSMVSAGHDIEITFKKLADKYKMDDREKASVLQVLADMGYEVRRDRGFLLDEEIDTTSSDNFDLMANYPG